MKRFLLLPGGGFDHNGKSYKPGEVVSSKLPLDTMFLGRFTKLPDVEDSSEASPVEEPVAKTAAPAKEVRGKTVETVIKEGSAKDVTDQFDEARELALVVVKSGPDYHVFDSYQATQPLNSSGLRKKLDVVKFLNQYGEE